MDEFVKISNLAEGFVVPIPRLPATLRRIFSLKETVSPTAVGATALLHVNIPSSITICIGSSLRYLAVNAVLPAVTVAFVLKYKFDFHGAPVIVFPCLPISKER